MQGFYRIAERTLLPEERSKRGRVHLFTVVTTQGACRRRRRIVREKTKKIRGGERRSDGDVKGKYRNLGRSLR